MLDSGNLYNLRRVYTSFSLCLGWSLRFFSRSVSFGQLFLSARTGTLVIFDPSLAFLSSCVFPEEESILRKLPSQMIGVLLGSERHNPLAGYVI